MGRNDVQQTLWLFFFRCALFFVGFGGFNLVANSPPLEDFLTTKIINQYLNLNYFSLIVA
jgi:hypothetical protein